MFNCIRYWWAYRKAHAVFKQKLFTENAKLKEELQSIDSRKCANSASMVVVQDNELRKEYAIENMRLNALRVQRIQEYQKYVFYCCEDLMRHMK